MAELRASHQVTPQGPRECIPMNNYDEAKQDVNSICESADCDADATSKVSVQVGDKGQIILFLCEKCKPRFSNSAVTSSP